MVYYIIRSYDSNDHFIPVNLPNCWQHVVTVDLIRNRFIRPIGTPTGRATPCRMEMRTKLCMRLDERSV